MVYMRGEKKGQIWSALSHDSILLSAFPIYCIFVCRRIKRDRRFAVDPLSVRMKSRICNWYFAKPLSICSWLSRRLEDSSMGLNNMQKSSNTMSLFRARSSMFLRLSRLILDLQLVQSHSGWHAYAGVTCWTCRNARKDQLILIRLCSIRNSSAQILRDMRTYYSRHIIPNAMC